MNFIVDFWIEHLGKKYRFTGTYSDKVDVEKKKKEAKEFLEKKYPTLMRPMA